MYGGAFPAQFSAPGDAHAMTKATSPQSFPSVPALCVDGRPFLTDPLTGRRYCACHMAPEGAQTHLHVAAASMKSVSGVAVPGMGPAVLEAAAMYDPMQLRGIAMHRLGPRGPHMTFDTSPAHPYGMLYSGLDVHGLGMRKAATRETTGPLKIWLQEHRKNPYPTKAEKIMLAIITKMTLTQVSTWFANARRRLKKESRLYTSNDDNGDDNHDKDDDDDDRESSLKQTTDDDSDVDINVDISDISDSDSEGTSRLAPLPAATLASTTTITTTSCSSQHVTTSSSDLGAGTSSKVTSLTSYLGPPYLPSYAASPYVYPRLSPPPQLPALAGVGGAVLPGAAVSRHLTSPVVSSITKLCLLLHPQLEQVFFPSGSPFPAATSAPPVTGAAKPSSSSSISSTSSNTSNTSSPSSSNKPKIWSISEIINSKAAAPAATESAGSGLQDTLSTASRGPESAFKLSPSFPEPALARLSSAFSFPAGKPDWLLPAVGVRLGAEGHVSQSFSQGQGAGQGSGSPGVGFGSPSRSQSSVGVPHSERCSKGSVRVHSESSVGVHSESSVRVHSPQTEALDLHTNKQDKDFT